MSSIQQTGMTEQLWPRVVYKDIQAFSNLVKLKTVVGIYASQRVILKKSGQENLHLIVQRVLDTQHIQLSSKDSQTQDIDLSAYNGGILDAPEQTRVTEGEFSTLRTAYMEEPVMAFRTTPVTQDGTSVFLPSGQIGIEEPDVNFVYDDCYNLTSIREYAHSDDLVATEELEVDAARKLLIFNEDYPTWLNTTSSFLYYERQLDNAIENNIVMSAALLNNSQATDVYVPLADVVFSGNTITTPTVVPWIKPDRFLKIVGGLNSGVTVKVISVAGLVITVDLVLANDSVEATLDGTVRVVEVDVTPPTNGSIEATLDGNLGSKLKRTHFTYGDALQIEAICSEIEEVTEDDLIEC